MVPITKGLEPFLEDHLAASADHNESNLWKSEILDQESSRSPEVFHLYSPAQIKVRTDVLVVFPSSASLNILLLALWSSSSLFSDLSQPAGPSLASRNLQPSPGVSRWGLLMWSTSAQQREQRSCCIMGAQSQFGVLLTSGAVLEGELVCFEWDQKFCWLSSPRSNASVRPWRCSRHRSDHLVLILTDLFCSVLNNLTCCVIFVFNSRFIAGNLSCPALWVYLFRIYLWAVPL